MSRRLYRSHPGGHVRLALDRYISGMLRGILGGPILVNAIDRTNQRLRPFKYATIYISVWTIRAASWVDQHIGCMIRE